MSTHSPSDEVQIAEIVAHAAAGKQTLEVMAGGSKRAFGRPVNADHILDVSGISGIINYEPAELILTARPGVSLSAIKSELRAHAQMLAFEPPAWSSLLGSDDEPTLGGVLACNLSGPRRVRAGAARDYFLGFSAVNGRGEIWKAGGKVMKNVSGFDMSKLLAGSLGTLSVITEVTLKVMPRPETECTILLHALADEIAIPTLSNALNTQFEVSGVAHLPASIARRVSAATVADGLGAVTAIRLEGPKPSVAFRAEAIEGIFGRGARLDEASSTQFWQEIGEVVGLLPPAGRVIWRLCPPPSQAALVFNDVRAHLQSAEAFFDWGGGLVWLSLDSSEAEIDAGAAIVRGAMKPYGGHSTLVVAPPTTRERIAVFEPVSGPLSALKARMKNSFDPMGVLNPGRMQEGH